MFIVAECCVALLGVLTFAPQQLQPPPEYLQSRLELFTKLKAEYDAKVAGEKTPTHTHTHTPTHTSHTHTHHTHTHTHITHTHTHTHTSHTHTHRYGANSHQNHTA